MEALRNVETVNAEIAAAREEMKNVRGRTTEVYARIVGYYRSVRNWNKGKREEYNHRTMFDYISAGGCACGDIEVPAAVGSSAKTAETAKATEAVKTSQAEEAAMTGGTAVRYEFFARKTCPNCPPVKEYLANVTMEGAAIDVDSDEGFARASSLGVFAAPTVIFYDASGAEVFRAHSVPDMKLNLEPQAVLS